MRPKLLLEHPTGQGVAHQDRWDGQSARILLNTALERMNALLAAVRGRPIMRTAALRHRPQGDWRGTLLLTLAGLAAAPSAPAALSAVKDCQPCALAFPDNSTLDLSFDLVAADTDARLIRSIAVSRAGSVIQSLPVMEMEPVPARGSFHFGVVQWSDGEALLGLVLGTGSANSRVQYWRYAGALPSGSAAPSQATGAPVPLVDLGEFPYLQVDKHSRQLYSREAGGHGGRDYTRREYALEGGKLLPVREETQRFEASTGHYRYTVRERREGRWVVRIDKHVDPARTE